MTHWTLKSASDALLLRLDYLSKDFRNGENFETATIRDDLENASSGYPEAHWHSMSRALSRLLYSEELSKAMRNETKSIRDYLDSFTPAADVLLATASSWMLHEAAQAVLRLDLFYELRELIDKANGDSSEGLSALTRGLEVLSILQEATSLEAMESMSRIGEILRIESESSGRTVALEEYSEDLSFVVEECHDTLQSVWTDELMRSTL